MSDRCGCYCKQLFQPSRFRPHQLVCSRSGCHRQRRRDYHRRKWRDAHPDYPKNYWQTHAEAAQRNRQHQRQRDRKRQVQKLVKNNFALDLKRSSAQVWLVGPSVRDLVKNNLAPASLLIFQPRESQPPAGGAS